MRRSSNIEAGYDRAGRRGDFRVFLNYRRSDAGGYAGRLYDALTRRFGAASVFMDVNTIEAGADIVQTVADAVASCDAIVVLIGSRWLDAAGADGMRRLDRPDDFVRLEIEAALLHGVRVIPALIEATEMPSPDDLPSTIRRLAHRNAVELSNKRWSHDIARLVAALESIDPSQASRPARDEIFGEDDLPSGSVTFLFSDIEGSTRLLKALRDEYPRALATHRDLIRRAIEAHHGHEIDTPGDGFFVAFATTKEAVLCALEAQRSLAGHEWPHGTQVAVRMGIHTGQAIPSGGTYTSLAVHRAARICAAGHGGQVLISQATQTILEDEEEDIGISFLDLGEQRLKDLDRPVRLYQLRAPGLQTDFPGLRTGASGTPVESGGELRVAESSALAERDPGPRPERADVPAGATRRLGRIALACAALIALALSLALYETNVLRRVELDTVDARFALRGKRTPPANVVLVAIDDTTNNEIKPRWPFPRSYHARLLRRISRDKPLVIAYDIQFTEPTTPAEDNKLIRAVAAGDGRVVLATAAVDDNGGTSVLGGDDVVRAAHAHVGNTAIPTDPGGVIRKVPYTIEKLKAFAIVSAEVASGRRISKADLGGRSAWIDYYGPPGTIPSRSFSRVLRGGVPPGFFTGKVVVVGATAATLNDLHSAATSGDQLMSGPEIEANAIETALRGFPLQSIPSPADLALIALMCLLTPAAAMRCRFGLAIVIALVGGGAFAVATQLAFGAGWIVSFVYPIAALVISSVLVLAARYVVALVEARARRGGEGELSTGTEVAGYRIERLIGRGAGGTVYLATDPVLRRQVALKILHPALSHDPRLRRRFLQESQLAAALDQPNVVPIYRAGEENGSLYIAMKFVRGTLADLLERRGPLELDHAAAVLDQMSDALDAAHASGLVHRDVSPGNILLDTPTEPFPFGQAYLSDFGLSAPRDARTNLGRVGTADYVAPEQIRGGPLDGRSDLYGLACVLYECLTGAPPFAAASEVAVIGGHLHRATARVSQTRSHVPSAVDAVLEKALAKSPDARYETCAAFAAAFRAAALRPAPETAKL